MYTMGMQQDHEGEGLVHEAQDPERHRRGGETESDSERGEAR